MQQYIVLSLLLDEILQNLNSVGGRGHFEYVYISYPLSHDKVPQSLHVGSVQPSVLADVTIRFTLSLAADELPLYQFNNSMHLLQAAHSSPACFHGTTSTLPSTLS